MSRLNISHSYFYIHGSALKLFLFVEQNGAENTMVRYAVRKK